MTKEKISIYTIGQSTRTTHEFIELLRSANINMIIVIRSIPRSRRNPQYNLETLPQSLAQYGIRYSQIFEPGELRSKSKTVSNEINTFWTNQIFHNYANYALSDEFESGLRQLIELSKDQRCAHNVLRGCLVAVPS